MIAMLLILEGKCLRRRAKPAHFGCHLPAVPPALLLMLRLGCVNAHPALLLRYRGPNPLFWQLMNGERQTDLTFHRMEADFDTGPMLLQRALAITVIRNLDM